MDQHNIEKPEIGITARMRKVLAENEGSVVLVSKARRAWDLNANHIELADGQHVFWDNLYTEAADTEFMTYTDEEDLCFTLPSDLMTKAIETIDLIEMAGLMSAVADGESITFDRDIDSEILAENFRVQFQGIQLSISSTGIMLRIAIKDMNAWLMSDEIYPIVLMENKLDPDNNWIYQHDDPLLVNSKEDPNPDLMDEEDQGNTPAMMS